MNKGLSESAIVEAVAVQASRSVTRKVIAHLQGMSHLLSGDDTELKTTWDEICAQVQDEQSIFWDAYDETVRSVVRACLASLAPHELDALWLQTDRGIDWSCDDEASRELHPVCEDDIVADLTRHHVYKAAEEWSNDRIRAFLQRARTRD